MKIPGRGGLGISLEGTVDVEDGLEVRPHHYIRSISPSYYHTLLSPALFIMTIIIIIIIRSILPQGPVGSTNTFWNGDQLLEVITGSCLKKNLIWFKREFLSPFKSPWWMIMILQVNGINLTIMFHQEVVKTLQEVGVSVILVCSRRICGPSPLHGTIVNNVETDCSKQAFNTRVRNNRGMGNIFSTIHHLIWCKDWSMPKSTIPN